MSAVRKPGALATMAVTLTLAVCTSSASATGTTRILVVPRASLNARHASTTTGTSAPQDVDAVYFLTPSIGWAAEDNSTRLLMTADGGAHWHDVSPPTLLRTGLALASGLTGGSFLSRLDFWVSAYEPGTDGLVPQLLFHTTDGGRDWAQVGSFPDGVGESWVSFLSDRQGWVALSNGAAGGSSSVTIYEATRAGGDWSVVSRSTSLTGRPGTPENPGNCGETGLSLSGTSRAPVLWLTGASNVAPCVYDSTDGGRRWTADSDLADPSKGWGGEAWPPVFSSESNGALVAEYGTRHGSVTAFYSTSNGGDSWVEHRLPSAGRGPVDVVSSSTWVMTAAKSLYRTTNSGVTWSRVPTALDFSGPSVPGMLDFVNTKDGWAIVDSGQLWHTTDGGSVWALELLPD